MTHVVHNSFSTIALICFNFTFWQSDEAMKTPTHQTMQMNMCIAFALCFESNCAACFFFCLLCWSVWYCHGYCFSLETILSVCGYLYDISVNELWSTRNWCFMLVSRSINFPVTESNNGLFFSFLSHFVHLLSHFTIFFLFSI